MSVPDAEVNIRARMAELGMPNNSVGCLITFDTISSVGARHMTVATLSRDGDYAVQTWGVDAGPWREWTGYRVEVFGRELADSPVDYPAQLWLINDPTGNLRIIELWQLRAFPIRSLLDARLEWRPGMQTFRPLIGGPFSQQPPGETRVRRLWRGIDLLWTMTTLFSRPRESDKDRPPGRGDEYDEGNQVLFITLLKEAIRGCVKAGDPVNPHQLESRMPHKAETIQKYLERFRIDLEALEHEAFEEASRD